MPSRPLAVTIIAWVFITVCGVMFVAALVPPRDAAAVERARALAADRPWELPLILAVRLAGVVGGVGLLRGHSWARWLLAAWMAWHIVLSAQHSIGQLVVHTVLFGAMAYFLFRRRSWPSPRTGGGLHKPPEQEHM